MTTEELNVIITAQNAEFNRRLDEVNSRLDSMGRSAQGSANSVYSAFKRLATKIAALGIGKMIANSITSGMEAIENESLFETSMGAYAESARAWSESLSDDLGLDAAALRKNSATLYTMTKNMGVASGEALSMSQSMTELAEDMASFYNISSDEAFAKLKSGLTGEAEPLKALGILVDETTVKQYAYANGIAEVGAELTQTEKVMARYAAIMAQTSTAQGDLARTIDSPSNQLRILKNEVNELMRDFGSTLMPTVSSLLSMARSGLQGIAPLVTGLGEGINTVAQGLLNMSPQTKLLVTLGLTTAVVIPTITKATSALKLLNLTSMGWLGKASLILGTIAAVSAIADINRTASETAAASEIALVAEGEGAEQAASGMDKLADSTEAVGEAVKGTLADIDTLNIVSGKGAGSVTGGLVTQNDLDLISDAVGSTDALSESISDLLKQDLSLDEFYKSLKEGFEWFTNEGWNGLKQTTSDIWTAMFGDDNQQYNALSRLTDTVRSFFGDNWTDFWIDVGGNISKALYGTGQERYESLLAIDNSFKGLFGTLGTDWSDFWKGIGSGIYDFAQGDLLGGLDVINGQFKGLFGELGEDWSELWQNVGSKLYQLFAGDDASQYTDLYQTVLDDTMAALRSGSTAEQAMTEALGKNLLTDSAAEYFAENYAKTYTEAFVDSLRADIMRTEGLYSQGYTEYSAPVVADYTSSPYSRDYYESRVEVGNNSVVQPIEIRNIIELDGEIVGESVTEYQNNMAMRGNWY